MTFDELAAASPYRALFRDRDPDPGECVVSGIDWGASRCTVTNGRHTFFPSMSEVYLSRKPNPTDPLEKLRPFLMTADNPEGIDPDQDAMEIVTELYKRIRLADDIRRVEESGSWDYCKQASLDWLHKRRRWIPIHPEAHEHQLNCVPPHLWRGDLMMAGEAYSGDFHLTTIRRGKKFYCCLLTERQVLDAQFLDSIPFADELPVLGVPEAKPKTEDQ